MFTLANPYSSAQRPIIDGVKGTVSAAHPLAVSAGLRAYEEGGNAVDALICAQAVLAVVCPDACGLGGDMLALVHSPSGEVKAINGTGRAPMAYAGAPIEGAMAIAVPGMVGAWGEAQRLYARLPLAQLLAPAIRLAQEGFFVSAILAEALKVQHERLVAGGAQDWPLFGAKAGDFVRLPVLAETLKTLAAEGQESYYLGANAQAIERAVKAAGGCLAAEDLAAHDTAVETPNASAFAGLTLMTQPPVTQGILLNMSAHALEVAAPAAGSAADHAAIELTEAAFAYRARAAEGMPLMAEELTYDPAKALHRGGPRAYLHTAGVACADAEGLVVSSLVSVFDDFGSAVYVPEGGYTLNNRAAGFGAAPNDAAPGKKPVHTLAPALVKDDAGNVWALATPGADGQVQTLLQILWKAGVEGQDLASAIAAPRWRSENGNILIEEGHPSQEALAALGHSLKPLSCGDTRFGAIVAAGLQQGRPYAGCDWRRLTAAGAA